MTGFPEAATGDQPSKISRPGPRWADNAIKLAVDMTVAAINRVNLAGERGGAGASRSAG